MNIKHIVQLSFIVVAGFWGCKQQVPIDERTQPSALTENITPEYTPPVTDPLATTTPIPNATPDPTNAPIVTPEGIAQLTADMKVCNEKGLLFIMDTTKGHCLPEVKLATPCNYDILKVAIKGLGFTDENWTSIKKNMDDTFVSKGFVLDQCGLIGDGAGVLVTHAFYQPNSKVVLGHYRNIFCVSPNSPKAGAADCNRLSTELFTSSD